MKKSNFVLMMLGTAAGVLFALGMCMVLIPEWKAITPGIIFGAAGLIIGIAAIAIWRKMEGRAPLKVSGKGALAAAVGTVGTLILGVGLCCCTIWGQLILGVIVGLLGLLLLLCLAPIVSGFKE